VERLINIFYPSFNSEDPLIFTQLDFWLFFLVVMVVFSFIHKHFLARSIFITIISLFFYFKTSGLYVLLLGLSLIVNFALGKMIFTREKKISKKWIIAISAIFNLLILGYFKYAYFFTDSFNAMFETDYEIVNKFAQWGNGFFGEDAFELKIFLPVGVSFFTFQSISYVVDIYREEIKPVKNFFDYTFFVTFFPQLVAGPIVRARDFIPQIRQPFQLDKNDFSWAVIQIVKGLLKKLILADYIAVHFIDKVADAPDAYPGFVSVLAMWGYSLQIYGDFSGYTDIAIGLSRLMGFKLKENFDSPYKARNVAEFWRRWHKSLGSWLRDYLYIPLGGNRTGGVGTYLAISIIFVFLIFITQWYELLFIYIGLGALYMIGYLLIPNFKKYVHRDLNLLITMVVGGLWHGASENFVIWGAMNGVALVIFKYWKRISPYEESKWWITHFWKIFITFNFITFTRIWFRLEEDGLPMIMLDQIWFHFDFSWNLFVEVLAAYQSVFWVMLIGFIIHWLPGKVKDIWEKAFTNMPMLLQALSVAVIIFLMYQMVSDTSKPFVYFQF
jgi:D-alanyl-lipoteichoic acid acyltransferase DltB (MBOAT superfamily)